MYRFSRCSVKGSINVPFSSVSFRENVIDNIGPHSSVLKSKGDKIVVVIGDEETDLEQVINTIQSQNSFYFQSAFSFQNF